MKTFTPGKLYILDGPGGLPVFSACIDGCMTGNNTSLYKSAKRGDVVMLLEFYPPDSFTPEGNDQDLGMKALNTNGEIFWYYGSLGGWRELTEDDAR